jgi:hypothetical protein
MPIRVQSVSRARRHAALGLEGIEQKLDQGADHWNIYRRLP